MKHVILGLSFLLAASGFTQDNKYNHKDLSDEAQINLATQFLPEKDKKEAKVFAYNDYVSLTVLRESDSYLTCVSDDPEKEGIEIVCYYSELEDFMNRGRVLKSQGKSSLEVREIRKSEIETGELNFPKGQSMMYVFKGKEENLDLKTGVLEKGKLRYVVYIPYATQESTGLPLSPSSPGMPWIMDPGTHRAHIMVTPN